MKEDLEKQRDILINKLFAIKNTCEHRLSLETIGRTNLQLFTFNDKQIKSEIERIKRMIKNSEDALEILNK